MIGSNDPPVDLANRKNFPERVLIMKLEDIRLRDPFILPVEEEQVYYLYGTNCGNVPGNAFPAFRSKDLKHWEGPFTVFSPEKDFWADRDFWAPEVHVYDGRYFMFASFKASDGPRGTQILV